MSSRREPRVVFRASSAVRTLAPLRAHGSGAVAVRFFDRSSSRQPRSPFDGIHDSCERPFAFLVPPSLPLNSPQEFVRP